MKANYIYLFLTISIFYLAECRVTNRTVDFEKSRKEWLDKVAISIKGKETKQVDSVFTNLKVLGGFEAENLLFAMDAWSKALGVSCNHCHNTSDFASDEKENKLISREMVVMGIGISEKLKSIKGLSAKPIVNCITCHRGQLKPAIKL